VGVPSPASSPVRAGGIRRASRWFGLGASAGGALLLLASCTFPIRFATPAEVAQATAPTPVTIVAPAAPAAPAGGGLDQLQADLRRLIAQVGPSVVRVDAGSASGSGLLLDSVGTVVTPASLVAGSQQVTITTSTGQQYSGFVSGSDPTHDVAVVRVSGATGLTAATFGDSSSAQAGDVVVVIGNQVAPSATVSQGIVSQTAATISLGSLTLNGLIVTTAPMASGTSGSALVNIAGQVIGMTTLGPTGSQPMGAAIPSNQVNATAQQLAAGGSTPPVGTATLGVTVSNAAGGGATVQSLVPGGPAATAGVQVGWTIVGIGGHPVASVAAIGPILATYKPGQRVTVTVQLPNGSTRSVQVVLGSG
jgi:putative serine protease PepD